MRTATHLLCLAVALLVFGSSASIAMPAAPSTGLAVQTGSGAVGGLLDGAVKEWRGIPYAAPPLGALRWRPPAAVASWSGTRSATTFAPPCIQLDSPSAGIFRYSGSTALSDP